MKCEQTKMQKHFTFLFSTELCWSCVCSVWNVQLLEKIFFSFKNLWCFSEEEKMLIIKNKTCNKNSSKLQSERARKKRQSRAHWGKWEKHGKKFFLVFHRLEDFITLFLFTFEWNLRRRLADRKTALTKNSLCFFLLRFGFVSVAKEKENIHTWNEKKEM